MTTRTYTTGQFLKKFCKQTSRFCIICLICGALRSVFANDDVDSALSSMNAGTTPDSESQVVRVVQLPTLPPGVFYKAVTGRDPLPRAIIIALINKAHEGRGVVYK